MEDKSEVRELSLGGVDPNVDREEKKTELHPEAEAGNDDPPLHGQERIGTTPLQDDEGNATVAPLLPTVSGAVPDRPFGGGIGFRQKVILFLSFVAGLALACNMARKDVHYITIDSTFKETKK